MKLSFEIDENDLKALYLKTKFAYDGYTYPQWVSETKKAYTSYIGRIVNAKPKTFSEWVNGQILAL